MVLRECALGGHGGHHRHLEQLGELAQLFRCLGPEHAMADVQHRPPRVQQQARGRGDVFGIAGRLVGACRGVIQGVGVDLRVPDVVRHLEQDRPGLAVADLREGSPRQLGDAIGEVDAAGPAGHVAIDGQRIELRRLSLAVLIGAAGDEQQGNAVGKRLGDGAEGVFDARSCLDDHDARLLTVGRAGVTVGHVDQGLLAAGDDRTNVQLCRGIDQRVIRVGEENFDPFDLQDPGQGVAASHSPRIADLRRRRHCTLHARSQTINTALAR